MVFVSGEIVGVEVLVCLWDENNNFVLLLDFILFVEEMGLIYVLGLLVLK